MFIGVLVTGRQPILGCILGYWIGFMNTHWLHREALNSSELDVRSAIRRMRRNFILRLGIISVTFVALTRLSTSWLIYFTVGLATGMVISILSEGFYEFLRKGGKE